MNIKEKLAENFLRYVSISTQSNPESSEVPSTDSQWELAKLLKSELELLGLTGIDLDEHCILTAQLPSNTPDEKIPVCGWVAHLDTVDVKLSPDVKAKLIRNYRGGDICQNEETGSCICVSDFPELSSYIGDDIIISDGSSVLGADNKAAIANIMTSLAVLKEDESIRHGDIYVCFVPDEECGLKGSKLMDFSKFPVDFAYTIDCCTLGEIVFETFNAGRGSLKIKGISAHPMNSKNNLVNPSLVAVDFINLLNRAETPEHTEKTEGYIWVTGIESNSSTAEGFLNIRDHDREKYLKKKAYLASCVEFTKLRHPKAELCLSLYDEYANIKDAVNDSNRKCIDYIYEAMDELGIEPKTIAMRGGTDGSFISSKGILTPNYFTGAHNFHSRFEFLPMSSFESSCLLTLKLIDLIAGK